MKGVHATVPYYRRSLSNDWNSCDCSFISIWFVIIIRFRFSISLSLSRSLWDLDADSPPPPPDSALLGGGAGCGTGAGLLAAAVAAALCCCCFCLSCSLDLAWLACSANLSCLSASYLRLSCSCLRFRSLSSRSLAAFLNCSKLLPEGGAFLALPPSDWLRLARPVHDFAFLSCWVPWLRLRFELCCEFVESDLSSELCLSVTPPGGWEDEVYCVEDWLRLLPIPLLVFWLLLPLCCVFWLMLVLAVLVREDPPRGEVCWGELRDEPLLLTRLLTAPDRAPAVADLAPPPAPPPAEVVSLVDREEAGGGGAVEVCMDLDNSVSPIKNFGTATAGSVFFDRDFSLAEMDGLLWFDWLSSREGGATMLVLGSGVRVIAASFRLCGFLLAEVLVFELDFFPLSFLWPFFFFGDFTTKQHNPKIQCSTHNRVYVFVSFKVITPIGENMSSHQYSEWSINKDDES